MESPLSPHCLVCGVPLAGVAAALLKWRGIKRNFRNPNTCTQCGAHLEEGRMVEMTVVFADISSFTTMTNQLGAMETSSVVDEFLRLASKTITSHGGFIDKFIGDAVMAFFNVPIKRQDHALAAVAAAVELQRQLPELSATLKRPVQASVGIATGYARVGRVGSDDIKDYTAIGAAVNEAARLQAHARTTEILVSRGVYDSVMPGYPGVLPESLALKGFPQPSTAYRLNGKPALPLSGADWLRDRPVMNWSAVLLALAGSGCLAGNLAAPLLAVFGGGAATALFALAVKLDRSSARFPLLVASSALAVGTLVSLERQRRLRRDCVSRRACLEMTPSEKRGVWAAAGLAMATLALVALEFWLHDHYRHRFISSLGAVLGGFI